MPYGHAGCNIYVSEGRSRELVDKIKVMHEPPPLLNAGFNVVLMHAGNDRPLYGLQASYRYSDSVALVNCFQDTKYNRTGLTLVGTAVRPVCLFCSMHYAPDKLHL